MYYHHHHNYHSIKSLYSIGEIVDSLIGVTFDIESEAK